MIQGTSGTETQIMVMNTPQMRSGGHRIAVMQVAWAIVISSAGSATALAQSRIVIGTEGRTLAEPPSPPPSFTIAILPDRTSGEDWGLPYLEQAVRDLNVIGPDAVFTIGDMVQGYTRSMEKYRAEAATYRSIVSKLAAPFYPLAGNHDVISGTRDNTDRRFEKEYQAQFGPLYYAVYTDHVTAIVLYSDERLESEPILSETQTSWALERIAEARKLGNPLVVLMHKPLWRYRDSGWERLHEALRNAGRDGSHAIVVAGHFHSIQRDPDRDGVEYHIVGTCGGSIDQHPLGGQLQHLTFVKATADGQTRVWHHPVGCTLASDFVLEADQSRAFRLKTWEDRFVVETVLDQPISSPLRTSVRLRVSNPIDEPITLTAQLVKSRPGDVTVEGYAFVTHTLVDIFNPFVTDFQTPLEQVGEVAPMTLAAGEAGTIDIPVRCEAQGRMIRPPEIRLTATFADGHGRTVPVEIRRRVPMRIRHIVTEGTAMDMRVSSWTPSVFDRPERDPDLGIFAQRGRLNVALVVYDNVPCFAASPTPTARVMDPLCDSVVLRFGAGIDEKVYLIEPMGPAGVAYRAKYDGNAKNWSVEESTDLQWTGMRREGGYGVVASVAMSMLGKEGDEVPFNVEVADNDETYHTQWRRWSARGAGSVIVLPGRFGE